MIFGFQKSQREAPLGGFPFLLSAGLAALFSLGLGAQEVEGRVWLEALDYLRERGAAPEIDTLRTKSLEERPSDFDLAEAFLEAIVARKDRGQLTTYVQALVASNGCLFEGEKDASARRPKPASIKLCGSLREAWKQRLGGILFFESSAPRWERARRGLEAGDCRTAQAELREIEVREGFFPDLILQKIRVAECLGETDTVLGLKRELEKLRF